MKNDKYLTTIVSLGATVGEISNLDNGNGIFDIIDNHINKTYRVSQVLLSVGFCFSSILSTGIRSITYKNNFIISIAPS